MEGSGSHAGSAAALTGLAFLLQVAGTRLPSGPCPGAAPAVRQPIQRNTLNGDEPQMALFDEGDDLGGLSPGGSNTGEVEHQRPVGEEAQGVLHPAVQLNEPIHKGQLGRQDKGQIGPAH